jgi:GNAT superfamily N-acetyltransferase
MNITEVRPDDTASIRHFFDLPDEVYRDDPVRVRENPQTMKIFSEPNLGIIRKPLLALDDGRAVARLVCIIHPQAKDDKGRPQGWIGYFEALPQARTGSLELLARAEELLAELGACTVAGPRTDNHAMGFLSKGFGLPQTVLTTHNPPYYPRWFKDAGFRVKTRSLSYSYRRSKYRPPAVTETGIRTRIFDRRDLAAEISRFNSLQNAIFGGRSGYIPRTRQEDEQLIRAFLPWLDDELVVFAEDETGQPVGILFCLPDIYQAQRGEKINRVRIVSIGVLPAWAGKGVAKAMGIHLMHTLLRRTEYEEAEASWIQQHNRVPQLLALRFGARPGREFLLFEKKLASSDPQCVY